MKPIYEDLYQFTQYVQPIDLSFHQYLFAGEEPVLIHTGNISRTETILPSIREILHGKELKYVFASHFEADEIGGLSAILKEYPDVSVICSAICARQLQGFGYKVNLIVKKPVDTLDLVDLNFEFINYPSEVHLQDGLLCYERKRGIFFSSDLMFSFGNGENRIIESSWQKEIDEIGYGQLGNQEKLIEMKTNLLQLSPRFIACGHGYAMKLNR